MDELYYSLALSQIKEKVQMTEIDMKSAGGNSNTDNSSFILQSVEGVKNTRLDNISIKVLEYYCKFKRPFNSHSGTF